MRKFARLSVLLLTIVALVTDRAPSYARVVQQQPPKQPGPGKKFVATPFGVDEVDLSDPRPGIAFGPPLAPAQPGPAAAQPQAAPAQPPQTGQDADPLLPVRLDFDNGVLHVVVRTIATYLGINYVIDPAVQGTVNITTNADLRRSDLFAILETILKVNGATMVRSGNFYQIVPAANAIRLPLEIQQPQPAAAPDDQIVIQVVPMKFVTADEMARLLTPFISESGNLVAQGSSILLITDRRSNLRKLL
jgi:general secretion pathway protein D